MSKLLAYFRIAFADALVYRATGFIWFLNDIASSVILIIFWIAVYQTRSSVGDFSLTQMIIYYLGVMIISTAVMSHPEYSLAEQIRFGNFVNYLLKPIKLAQLKICHALAWKAVRLFFLIPGLFIIYQLTSSSINFSVLNYTYILFGILSLIITFVTLFLIKITLGLTTFWTEESNWLFYTFNITLAFFSGELIPLDLFPPILIQLNNYLPFKYFLYFPLTLLMGKLTDPYLIYSGLLLQFGWFFASILLYRIVLNFGLKKYSAYGG